MNTDWLNHPAMQKLSPQKKEILLDFIREADGMSMEKAMPVLVRTNAKLKAAGLSFSPEENELITEILTKDMSPVERMRLDTIRKMLFKH